MIQLSLIAMRHLYVPSDVAVVRVLKTQSSEHSSFKNGQYVFMQMSSKENCSVSKKIRMRVKGDEINGEKWQRKTERDRQCKQVLLKPKV